MRRSALAAFLELIDVLFGDEFYRHFDILLDCLASKMIVRLLRRNATDFFRELCGGRMQFAGTNWCDGFFRTIDAHDSDFAWWGQRFNRRDCTEGTRIVNREHCVEFRM